MGDFGAGLAQGAAGSTAQSVDRNSQQKLVRDKSAQDELMTRQLAKDNADLQRELERTRAENAMALQRAGIEAEAGVRRATERNLYASADRTNALTPGEAAGTAADAAYKGALTESERRRGAREDEMAPLVKRGMTADVESKEQTTRYAKLMEEYGIAAAKQAQAKGELDLKVGRAQLRKLDQDIDQAAASGDVDLAIKNITLAVSQNEFVKQETQDVLAALGLDRETVSAAEAKAFSVMGALLQSMPQEFLAGRGSDLTAAALAGLRVSLNETVAFDPRVDDATRELVSESNAYATKLLKNGDVAGAQRVLSDMSKKLRTIAGDRAKTKADEKDRRSVLEREKAKTKPPLSGRSLFGPK